MSFLREIDGDWYVCSRHGRKNSLGFQSIKTVFKSEYLIKWGSGSPKGYLMLGDLIFPKQFVGKRVRFKLEVLEDGD